MQMAYIFIALCVIFAFCVFFYRGQINNNVALLLRDAISIFYLKLTLIFLALAGEFTVLSAYARFTQKCWINDRFIYWHISLAVVFVLGVFEFFRRLYFRQISLHLHQAELLSNMFIIFVGCIGMVFLLADVMHIESMNTLRDMLIEQFSVLSYHLIPAEDVCTSSL